MSEERHSLESPLPGEIKVNVPGLRPDTKQGSTRLDNLQDPKILEMVEEELSKRKGISSLIDAIQNNKKKAIFFTGAGVLTIIVGAIGVEFGIRHGRDFRQLLDLIEKRRGDKAKKIE